MKNHLILLFALLLICLSSCQEDDPCYIVECQNEGVCVSGVCDCPLGYGGEFCETFIREQVIGGFDVVSNCIGGTAETDRWGISGTTSSLDAVLINNFHFPALNVNAIVTNANTLDIEEQYPTTSFGNLQVSGTGIIEEDGRFTLEYSIINQSLSDTISCSVNAIRN